MTVGEYIRGILTPLGIGDAQMTDIVCALDGLSETDLYCAETQRATNVAITEGLAALLLAPRMENVNESGFSMSWNFADLSKWYMYMCRKWGVAIDPNLDGILGISRITDKTDIW